MHLVFVLVSVLLYSANNGEKLHSSLECTWDIIIFTVLKDIYSVRFVECPIESDNFTSVKCETTRNMILSTEDLVWSKTTRRVKTSVAVVETETM